jgi:hypothetical protein
MADVVFVGLTLVFFALCGLYVRACERLISGPEDAAETPTERAR